ncbi:pirin family protein [Vibrio breoganii]|uniref:pirin family protein n=1 Tax=Vibrio breoganii TaxID=553239 RepID=UPI000C84B7FD|nr:pirin family protein [Vibrio breoganii]PMG96339.1 pirin [Vibrio breoganii]PMO80607.1 pirin [Vibrio breoganii]PMO86236.1 pirin [Vibrio breoganii]
MITLRRSNERGSADHSWLQSKHTFSFANYYDPQHMGFSALRVINDDLVHPEAGFDTHGHKNMEIISFVLEGTIAHKDSEGNVQELPAGEFQLMSAGKGIYHSEYNPSSTEPLKFLQIWIEPNEIGGKPGYQQKDFGKKPGITTIATPDGKDDSLAIKQDMSLHQLVLEANSELKLDIEQGRSLYLHQVQGSMETNDLIVSEGDGIKVRDESNIKIANHSDDRIVALIFDLP